MPRAVWRLSALCGALAGGRPCLRRGLRCLSSAPHARRLAAPGRTSRRQCPQHVESVRCRDALRQEVAALRCGAPGPGPEQWPGEAVASLDGGASEAFVASMADVCAPLHPARHEVPRVDLKSEPVYKTVAKFLKGRFTSPVPLVISLSGGVDSMVLCTCLQAMALEGRLRLHALHIDYGCREESSREAAFVRAWTSAMGIELEFLELDGASERVEAKRDAVEQKSRLARYAAYRALVERVGAPAVCMGHHRDDGVENILDNLVMGRGLFEIKVAHPQTEIEDVRIWRPLLPLGKAAIRDFAHRRGVPHLRDNEGPNERRLIWRRVVLPTLSDAFGPATLDNIARVGEGTVAMKGLLDKFVFEPVWEKVRYYPFGIVIPFHGHETSPTAFWSELLIKIFHEAQMPMITKLCLDRLVKAIHAKDKQYAVTVSKAIVAVVDDARLIFMGTDLWVTKNERLAYIERLAFDAPRITEGGSPQSDRCGLWQIDYGVPPPAAPNHGLSGLLSGQLDVWSERGLEGGKFSSWKAPGPTAGPDAARAGGEEAASADAPGAGDAADRIPKLLEQRLPLVWVPGGQGVRVHARLTAIAPAMFARAA